MQFDLPIMGSCVSRNKSISLSNESKALRRKVSSIIMSPEEAERINNEEARKINNDEPQNSFRNNKLPSQGKALQGSLLIKSQKVVFSGLSSQSKQTGFEDKRMSINHSEFNMDHLASFGISVTCKKGLKPGSPNQDDYFVSLDKKSIILGVFDGHGLFGHDISNFVHSTLPSILLSQQDLKSDPVNAIKSSFQECQNQLLLNSEQIDCTASGCTATLVCILNKKLFIAHVGDSRAIIAQEIDSKIVSKNLTEDHRPDLLKESERIRNCGGEIRKLSEDAPFRIFRPGENFPGLNMSRAFGDTICQELGVICEPEISEIEVKDTDQFILICSDGVWEFITSQDAVNLVIKSEKDPRKATEKIAALAWMRWKNVYDLLVDDITAMIIHLNNKHIKEYFTDQNDESSESVSVENLQ